MLHGILLLDLSHYTAFLHTVDIKCLMTSPLVVCMKRKLVYHSAELLEFFDDYLQSCGHKK